MSILDFVTDNWQQILGGGTGAEVGGAAISSPQLPPPTAPAQGYGGGYSPSGVMDQSAVSGATTYIDPAMSGLPVTMAGPPPGPPPGQGFGGGAPNAMATNGPPPGPPPGAGYGGGAPNAMATNGGPPGPPLSLAPPNPGPVNRPGPPMQIAPKNNYANLAMLLGANSQPSWQRGLQAGLAGLGQGLSTVQGNTGAGAFARGMGGALSAGMKNQQQQRVQDFNMNSTYFRNMLAANNQGDVEEYRKAQAAYLNSRAQAIQVGGGSTAYQNDPFWKTMKIEDAAQKHEKDQQLILQKQWAMNTANGNAPSPDQQQADLDRLQKGVNDFRTNMYKSAGIDPAQGKKMLTFGQSETNPFPKAANQQEFDSKVLNGAWYDSGEKYGADGTWTGKLPDGTSRTATGKPGSPVIMQRTIPPGGWENYGKQPANSSSGSQMQDYYDTGLATQPVQ